MPTVEEYIAATDNANDYADSLMEKLEQRALEDMDDLYTSTGNRDVELWSEMGVNPDLVLSDYDEIERDDRDLNWTTGLGGISAASLHQFTLDNREETIIKPTAYRQQEVGVLAVQMTRAQLVQAGKRGFEVEGVKGFVKLSVKYTDRLAFLRDASNPQLYNTLVQSGAMRPLEKTVAANIGNVSRMTSLRPGAAQFKEEVAGLINSNARRGLKGMNRKAVESLYTTQAIGGDLERLMVWIVEGGKNTCSYCMDRAGDVETYATWVDLGTPGAEVCKGGDA